MKEYLKDEGINLLLELKGKELEKKAITLGSNKPDSNSIVENGQLVTFVKNSNGEILEETRNDLKEGVVIARNPEPIGQKNGKDIYNEWLVPQDTWLKNYGQFATDNFKPYKKAGTIIALEIDDQVLKLLGSTDGKTAKIAVDWNKDGMTVYKGGVLTDKGYGIAPEELLSTYQEVKRSSNLETPKSDSTRVKI